MSNARSLARQLAVQALYQWQIAGQDLIDIQNQFFEEHNLKKVDKKYFKELLQRIPKCIDELDQHTLSLLDRNIEEVDPIERAIIRIGTYELTHRPDVPVKVVINESVELAKKFGADQSYKYVNGILDGVAKKLRSVELNNCSLSKK